MLFRHVLRPYQESPHGPESQAAELDALRILLQLRCSTIVKSTECGRTEKDSGENLHGRIQLKSASRLCSGKLLSRSKTLVSDIF